MGTWWPGINKEHCYLHSYYLKAKRTMKAFPELPQIFQEQLKINRSSYSRVIRVHIIR